MSAATSADGTSADLVYIGEGDEASILSRDVHRKIVLVNGVATEEVAARASCAGALGQLHISPNEHLYEMCISPVWGKPLPAHAGGSSRPRWSVPSPGTTASCCASAASGNEAVRVSMHAEVDTGWRKTPLLVAELDAARTAPSPVRLVLGPS